jgi:hypothetical protein
MRISKYFALALLIFTLGLGAVSLTGCEEGPVEDTVEEID